MLFPVSTRAKRDSVIKEKAKESGDIEVNMLHILHREEIASLRAKAARLTAGFPNLPEEPLSCPIVP